MKAKDITIKINELKNMLDEFINGNEHLIEEIDGTELANIDETLSNLIYEVESFEERLENPEDEEE